MPTLTKKQKQIYEYVKNHIDRTGVSPTFEEIRKRFRLKALSGVHQHIDSLIKKGLLTKNEGARGVGLKRGSPDILEIPIMGTIAAGQPIEAIEIPEDIIKMGREEIPGTGKLYALRVVGNSMIDEGIFDGDTVIIKQQSTADDGETVVAIIDDNEATLKKIYREKNRFRLQPANLSLFPIYRAEVEIRGVVVKTIRNYGTQSAQKDVSDKIFRLAELFCGPGGLALGAISATSSNQRGERFGVKPVWANDIDESTCKTYARNIHAGDMSGVVVGPVEKIDFKKVPKFDALAFGFPCNDFSVVGEHKGFDGKFGPLYTYGLKAINIHNPEWFMAENVSGLQSANEGKAFRKILEDLEKAGKGYKITAHLYKFEEYGVPQYRHRVVIIGIRKDLGLIFKVPAPTTAENFVTARDAFENPPIPKNAPNCEVTKQAKIVVERLKHIPAGKNVWYEGLPEHLRLNVKGAKMSQIYKRLNPNQPSYTITGSGGGGTHGYHWSEPRALTNRERARIQTFPDDFVFEGSKEQVRKQIGMAVPPRAAKIIVEAVLKTFAGVSYKWIEPSVNTASESLES
jgi:DNA (cytosine-5)-methyltransferase 1